MLLQRKLQAPGVQSRYGKRVLHKIEVLLHRSR
jgi:hypothetical protein